MVIIRDIIGIPTLTMYRWEECRKDNMESLISACARNCVNCSYFENRKCRGCLAEHERLREENWCSIYRCVNEKNIKNCSECNTDFLECETWVSQFSECRVKPHILPRVEER